MKIFDVVVYIENFEEAIDVTALVVVVFVYGVK